MPQWDWVRDSVLWNYKNFTSLSGKDWYFPEGLKISLLFTYGGENANTVGNMGGFILRS